MFGKHHIVDGENNKKQDNYKIHVGWKLQRNVLSFGSQDGEQLPILKNPKLPSSEELPLAGERG